MCNILNTTKFKLTAQFVVSKNHAMKHRILSLDNRYDLLWKNIHYKLNMKTLATHSCFNHLHVKSQL